MFFLYLHFLDFCLGSKKSYVLVFLLQSYLFCLLQGEAEALSATNEMTVTAEDPDDPGRPQAFTFDRVFGPEEPQEVCISFASSI